MITRIWGPVLFMWCLSTLSQGREKPGDTYESTRLFLSQKSHSLCNSTMDCTPLNMRHENISDFIECSATGLCLCHDCFELWNDICHLKLCQNFVSEQGCIDSRKSQIEVVLLSAFLSSIGAANFYIGQYVLGGVQLGLLALMVTLSCVVVLVPCCVIYLGDDENDYEDYMYCFCCVGLSAITAVVILFVIIVWWIIDLSIFIGNGRADHNGCLLYANL